MYNISITPSVEGKNGYLVETLFMHIWLGIVFWFGIVCCLLNLCFASFGDWKPATGKSVDSLKVTGLKVVFMLNLVLVPNTLNFCATMPFYLKIFDFYLL